VRWPWCGSQREHAEAGETIFKTPLSWLFALQALRATIELPAGITLELAYDHGEDWLNSKRSPP